MEYKCNICNKLYSSYQSLWIHNKKFHSPEVINCNNIVINSNKNVIKKTYNCKFCNKEFNMRQYKYSHQKSCKNKANITNKDYIDFIKILN